MSLNYFFDTDHYVVQGGCGDSEIIIPDYYDDGINGYYPVTEINTFAFFSCSSLNKLIIGKNVNLINYASFGNCINLKTVIFKSKNIGIYDYAFGNCFALLDIFCEGDVLKNEEGGSLSAFAFDQVNISCKFIRKKYFVTGWSSTLIGKPVVLWSDNVIKSGGTGKLISKKRPTFIYALQSINQINNPSEIITQGLRFYITTQTLDIVLAFGLGTLTTNVYYDETNAYALWAIRAGHGAGLYWVITPIDRVGLYDIITGLGLGNKYYLRGSDNALGSYGGGGDWSGNGLTVASLL